jgi:hypothetical protein
VELNIYNFTGRKTKTLMKAGMAQGAHQVVFNASVLPAGMYFCQLRVNGVTETLEMAVTR